MRTPDGIIIARVLPEHFNEFRIFDPYDCLDLGKLPEMFVLGALDDGTYKSENTPVGVFIAKASEASMTIEWMATDPAYRNLGIGDAFLEAAFIAAQQMGISSVEARIRSDASGAGEYFSFGGFEEEKPDKGEYHISLSDVLDNGRFPDDEGDEYIRPVESLTSAEFAAVEEYLAASSNAYFLVPGMRLKEVVDPALSLAWMEDGKPGGALMFITSGHNHYPVVLEGRTGHEMNALIVKARERVKELHISGDNLIVRMNTAYIQSLVKGILGTEGFMAVRRLSAGTEIEE